MLRRRAVNISILWWIVIGLSIALSIVLLAYINLYRQWRMELFRRRSQSSKYGKLTEQFLPLVNIFPWNPQNFRFLGTPVDGIQFEDNRIILVEFKTSQSQLSTSQRQIKDLVDKGKVSFELISIR